MDQRTEDSVVTPVTPEPVLAPKTAPSCLQIDPNGATVFVEFFPQEQCVRVDYDKTKLKTWDMIIGILHMALVQAETARNMTIGANMQKKQAEEMKRQQEAFETQMMAQALANEPNNRKIHVGR